jgi:cytochrome c-type biogenesis protein CcmF
VVVFQLIVSPMVTWLWAGAMIIAIGGLISLIPATLFARRRRPEPEHAHVAVRELA